jgi:hypothetical protein
MRDLRTPQQEAAEDIFFGQLVIIWARWFVIATGVALVVWSASDLGSLTANILLVVALMIVNFFLHGAYALEKPQNRGVVTLVSLIDLAVVTLIVLFFQGTGGFASPFFVFYYPFVVAFALVFPWRVAAVYTIATIAAYTVVCTVTFSIGSADDVKTLVMRAITLAGTGGLATYYWRIQRGRRRAAAGMTVASAPRLSTART